MDGRTDYLLYAGCDALNSAPSTIYWNAGYTGYAGYNNTRASASAAGPNSPSSAEGGSLYATDSIDVG